MSRVDERLNDNLAGEEDSINQRLEKHGQIMADQYECHLIKSATSSAAQVDEMPQRS